MARIGSGKVVAKEAIVINVGGRPPEYGTITVVDRKTGDPTRIRADVPTDEGDEGVPYAFKAGEKVSKSHPAVKENPGAFVPLEDWDDEAA